MMKIKSIEDFKDLNKKLKSAKLNKSNTLTVKVSMSTCGIASGAKETMDYLINEFDNQAIDAEVIKTGCMGYCYAEPTIEVSLPNKEPVVFSYVDTKKAQEIIEQYIVKGEQVEGIIPINYESIDLK